MDAKSLLEQILQSGKHYIKEGRELAEDKLDVPEAGEERDAMLSGMSKGAMAAGALALLLGTGAGRRLTGSALKLGSIAAIGGLAFNAYQKWQATQSDTGTVDKPFDQLNPDESNKRSTALVKAMIAAAKADGHIDNEERLRINKKINKMQLADSTFEFLQQEIERPLDVAEIASQADSLEAAAEMYVVSLLVIDMDNAAERLYLNELAIALKLPDEIVAQLEQQVNTA